MQQENSSPIQDGTPYFLGDEALVKFTSGSDGIKQYWLVSKNDKTVRPFESNDAIRAVFGDQTKEAVSNAMKIITPKVDPDGEIMEGVLEGFSILDPEYSIRRDGSAKPLHFSSHQLKSRYGKPVNEKAEIIATEVLDGLLNLLKKNEEQAGVTADFIDEIKEDEKLMAFYVSALAYGNYTMEGIYSDIIHSFDNSK